MAGVIGAASGRGQSGQQVVGGCEDLVELGLVGGLGLLVQGTELLAGGDEGGNVGPELDGTVSRGTWARRLSEDAWIWSAAA